MSKYLVVDASVWVARLITQDAFHDRSRHWLDVQQEHGVQFVAPTLLLVEVAAAISRRTGDRELAKQAVEALQALPDLRLVEMYLFYGAIVEIVVAQHEVNGASHLFIKCT